MANINELIGHKIIKTGTIMPRPQLLAEAIINDTEFEAELLDGGVIKVTLTGIINKNDITVRMFNNINEATRWLARTAFDTDISLDSKRFWFFQATGAYPQYANRWVRFDWADTQFQILRATGKLL